MASLLLAGAWTAADAKLTVLPSNAVPSVATPYVIGTGFNDLNGTVGNLISATGTLAVSTTQTVKEFGHEWVLVAASVKDVNEKEVKGAFYLKNADEKYLSITSGFKGLLVEKAEEAVAFVFNETKDVISPAIDCTLNGVNITTTLELAINASSVDLVAAGDAELTYPRVKFAEFSAPKTITGWGNNLMNTIGGDYYYLAQENIATGEVAKVLKYENGKADFVPVTGSSAPAEDAYMWKVTKTTASNVISYTFESKVDGSKKFTYTTDKEYSKGFNLNNVPTGVADGDLFGIYRSPLTSQSGKVLNDILGEGFTLTFKVNKDSKKEVELTDAFAGTLTAVVANGTDSKGNTIWDATTTDTEFKIKSGKKFLALKEADNNINGVEGEFVLIAEKDLDEDGYITDFSVESYYGEDQTIVNRFKAIATDGTEYFAYIVTPSATTKAYLTSIKDGAEAEENYPYISLNDNNFVELEDLVHVFWNISYADTKANAKEDGEEYKYGRVLAIEDEDNNGISAKTANYVLANTVSLSSPETQWAVVDVDAAGKVTLQNRETKTQITGVTFRYTDRDNVWKMYSSDAVIDGNDLVKVAKITDFDKFDGFKAYKESEIRNNKFYLGQYHAVAGNNHAYFVENHTDKASHQIGMTAEEGKADKWNLRFATKTFTNDDDEEVTVVDTVYVETKFYTLKADGSKETDANKIKKSSLAIIPYYFQKVSNREYVEFDNETGKKFYACDEDKKVKATTARFALKKKINDDVYNFVEIVCEDFASSEDHNDDVLSGNKVYVANSADKGSLKRMDVYAEDNNSLMVVVPAEAPEYHLVSEGMWGDTISLARKENAAQVLYEKFDAKSIVKDDTLSFLNIDNVKQFNINPALFVDTAYVKRGTEEDPNTCYQYLLAVRHSYGRHIDGCGIPGHEQTVGAIDTVYGDFLINLVDTANLYNDIHNNWYINEDEAGNKFETKLAFVTGFHTLTDNVLNIVKEDGDTIKIDMDTPDFNVAKFAFRYTDSDAKTFKIQTQYKQFVGGFDTAEEAADYYAENPELISNEGYLRWVNGTVVVTNNFEDGDEFVITERVDRDPVANESIDAASEVSVIATNGAVIIKGAEGKKVSISNVLGQTIANTVVTSSEATISAPAGVVVVAVEGEAAVKAIVK
ncbi:hypothetical protein DXD68_08450 [Parabacteroides sp. TM07-1AC]|nr:hypothetical protein DXD68_08450 [Parabacteroides sp. TM07-1AC]